MDTGARKFGVALLVASGAVAAGRFDWAFATLALYTVANVILKLKGKDPEAAE